MSGTIVWHCKHPGCDKTVSAHEVWGNLAITPEESPAITTSAEDLWTKTCENGHTFRYAREEAEQG